MSDDPAGQGRARGGAAPPAVRRRALWKIPALALAALLLVPAPGPARAAAPAPSRPAASQTLSYADWKEMVPPETPVAAALETDGYALFAAACGIKLFIFWYLLSHGRGQRIQDAIDRRVKRPRLAAPLCLVTYLLLYELALLPVVFIGYRIDRHYGLVVEPGGRWAADLLRGWAVDWCVTVPTMLLLLWMMRSIPRWWWLAATGLVAMVSAATIYLAPLVIDPLFHHFRPLRDPSLRSAILQLAGRAHVHISGVYVGEFSSTTTEGNAYVTGLGSSQRIVLWDTILKKFSPHELQSIIAHELGHYALHHIARGLALGVAGSLFIFAIIARVLDSGVRRGWLRRIGEPACMVPLAATAVLLNYLGLPVIGVASRAVEAQADAFSLRITNHPDWFIQAMQRLSRQDFDNPWPNPVLEFIFYSHPSLSQRIHMAARYARAHRIELPRSLIAGQEPLRRAQTPGQLQRGRSAPPAGVPAPGSRRSVGRAPPAP